MAFRFQAFGRPVRNSKKFEEGIFSDLRNLKAGSDATLEDPKSPFLDFLYKNNCIRTQKKQKVFYWYSVPHDRLFIDALERDLKRENMNQDATTVAVAEPALSFRYDTSQSLYEQLTKAQQANNSSDDGGGGGGTHASTAYGQPVSPVVRTVDAMPPPQMAPLAVPILPEDPSNPAATMYGPMTTSEPLLPNYVKRESDVSTSSSGTTPFDRIARLQQRHASLPTFVEYSPAPSFVSSQLEDYSSRGLSYEPITPPQQTVSLGPEPSYIANEETGLFTAIPAETGYPQLPPLSAGGGGGGGPFTAPPPPRAFSAVYSIPDGSPTYKQRKQRSSATPTGAGPYTAHRPSVLRRSMSGSGLDDAVVDLDNPGRPTSYSELPPPPGLIEGKDDDNHYSGGELSSLPSLEPVDNASSFSGSGSGSGKRERSGASSSSGGPMRRAQSTTVIEGGPYPQRSHSCPIPSCGRLFKRLEHLKRYVVIIKLSDTIIGLFLTLFYKTCSDPYPGTTLSMSLLQQGFLPIR